MLDGRHVASSGASDRHCNLIRGSSGVDSSDGRDLHRNQTAMMRSDRSSSWKRGSITSIHYSSDGRDISRFSSHVDDTWNSLIRSITIGRWEIDERETPSRPWSGWILQSQSSARRDLHQTVDRASRRTTIDARSWPDHRAIVVQSARNRGAFSTKLELFHRGIDGIPRQLYQTVSDRESTARSTHDRSAIGALFEAKSWLSQGQSGSYVVAK